MAQKEVKYDITKYPTAAQKHLAELNKAAIEIFTFDPEEPLDQAGEELWQAQMLSHCDTRPTPHFDAVRQSLLQDSETVLRCNRQIEETLQAMFAVPKLGKEWKEDHEKLQKLMRDGHNRAARTFVPKYTPCDIIAEFKPPAPPKPPNPDASDAICNAEQQARAERRRSFEEQQKAEEKAMKLLDMEGAVKECAEACPMGIEQVLEGAEKGVKRVTKGLGWEEEQGQLAVDLWGKLMGGDIPWDDEGCDWGF